MPIESDISSTPPATEPIQPIFADGIGKQVPGREIGLGAVSTREPGYSRFQWFVVTEDDGHPVPAGWTGLVDLEPPKGDAPGTFAYFADAEVAADYIASITDPV